MHCDRESIFNEIDVLEGLNHENVIYLKDYFEEGNRVRPLLKGNKVPVMVWALPCMSHTLSRG